MTPIVMIVMNALTVGIGLFIIMNSDKAWLKVIAYIAGIAATAFMVIFVVQLGAKS